MLRNFFPLHRNRQQMGRGGYGCEVDCVSEKEIRRPELGQDELLDYLRGLAEWKNNDVVELAFLEQEDGEQVDGLDLSGVVELKRNANGTFEAKFVDKVRVLGMIRELMEERRDGELGEFLDGLYGLDGGER